MAGELVKVKFPIHQYKDNCPALTVDVANGKTEFVTNETKVVKVSDNEVVAYYDGYKQTITAEGIGNERYNFKSVIEEVTT